MHIKNDCHGKRAYLLIVISVIVVNDDKIVLQCSNKIAKINNLPVDFFLIGDYY